jgi:site-specific recombinase
MKDWKNLLDERTREELKELIERAAKHRYAYSQADDIRIAQLWVALAEISKDLKEIKEKLGKVEEPFKAIIEIGEEEKRKAIQRIVEEIIKPADKETQEVTRKLVDTLMKF